MIRSSYFEKSVSRETLLKLTKYHEFLIENNRKMSLISKKTEEIAVKRFETYEKNINPVIDFYKQSKLLKVINGEGSITQINNEISEIIEGIKG